MLGLHRHQTVHFLKHHSLRDERYRYTIYADGSQVMEVQISSPQTLDLVRGSIGVWKNTKPTRPLVAEIDQFAIHPIAFSPALARLRYLKAKGVSVTPVSFEKQIRPLLAARCFECHGPDTAESGLRLDIRDSAYRGGESGEPAIVNHKFRPDEPAWRLMHPTHDIEA